MPNPRLLSFDQIGEIYAAAVEAGLDKHRDSLLAGLDPYLTAGMSSAGAPGAQLLTDLNTLNGERLADGSAPLTTWLKNAKRLAGGVVEANVFERMLQAIPDEPGNRQRHVVHNIPCRPNTQFVGRSDLLARLRELLAGSKPPAVSLCGLPGMGKTQIALAYAHEHLDARKTVLWVNAKGPELTARFAALATTLGLPRPPMELVTETAAAVRAALERGGPHLLVLDNVDDRTCYLRHLPRVGNTRVLITTRRTDLDGTLYINVEPLSKDVALALLLGTERFDDRERAAANELAEALGYLTFALMVASHLLAKRVRTPSTLLADLRSKDASPWLDRPEFDVVYSNDQSISRLIDASVGQLDQASPLDRFALQVLLVAGWFAPMRIHGDLLLDAARRAVQPADAGESFSEALERLLDLGLVRYDAPFVVFHRLIQRYARDRDHKVQNGTAERAANDALANLVRRIPSDPLSLLQLAPHRPHIEHTVERLVSAAPVQPESIEMTLRLVQHLLVIGEYARAAELARLAAKGADATPLLGELLHEQARALERQWKHDDALALYRRALAIKEATLGDAHWKLSCTLGAMGQVLCYEGRYTEALPLFERAERIVNATPDMPRREVAEVDILAGRAHILREDYGRAIAHLSRALGLLTSEYGDTERPELSHALHAYGRALAGQGRYPEAIDALEKALRDNERLLGLCHAETARNRHALGWALMAQGKYADAREAFERALAIKRQLAINEATPGTDGPETARTLHALGWVAIYQGRLEEAVTHLEAARAIQTRTLKPNNAYAASTQYALGWAFAQRGELARGHELLQGALAALRGEPGMDAETEPLVARVLQALAWVLARRGQPEEGLRAIDRAVAIADRTLGAEHDQTLQMRFERGRLRLEAGDAAGADEMRSAASGLALKLGDEHPVVLGLRSPPSLEIAGSSGPATIT
ncbi:tetratricopeptide repeat protein [Sorangium sp. So ce327]|uniref:tetratricopeptide repeat protein n=1 Tax=Sorangium sp. So ce327 TaxID=3133301 RepID=UPI003F632F28